MPPINRGTGITESERFLAGIAEQSFLSLWTYANVFRDQHINNNAHGDGKEICDVLVVCGDDVIIFSDKTVKWCEDKPQDVAWCRWYKAAIEKSADQIHGAARWIREHPDRLFIDNACTIPLPIELPPPDRMRIHGVVIAIGANDAIKAAGGHHLGIPSIDSSIRGQQHRNRESPDFKPFAIGDIDPAKPFVHVFDQVSMALVMQAENTITDFTDYLTGRALALRKQRIGVAMGEDDLLGFYMSRTRPSGKHDFIRNSGAEIGDGDRVRVDDYYFQRVIHDPGFLRKQEEDEISFLWDRLIELFAGHLLGGTSISATGGTVEVSEAEIVLQTMARATRLERRLYSIGIDGAISKMIQGTEPRFVRFFLPHETAADRSLAYIFMMMDFPEWIDPDTPEGLAEYRQARRNTMMIYNFALMMEHPELETVIGIAMNAPPGFAKRKDGSEDVSMTRRDALTDEVREKVIKAKKDLNIMPNYTGTSGAARVYADEYPGN